MDTLQLKKIAFAQTDKDRESILALGREIYKHPETGYRETATTKRLADALECLGLEVERNIAVTGCRAHTEKTDRPKIAVMGELDSVICDDHPDCVPKTGAVHACGHNIQVSVMYGIASALTRTGILKELGGSIDFMAVPAEEYIELDFRKKLKEAGKIKYYSGKAELAYKGAFDDVDMCMMIHNWPLSDGYKTAPQNTGTGFVGKKVTYIGKQSHAGAAPWDGINALNMAMIAINSMHVQRETFKDSDFVRVHQIITKGGSLLNSVPSEVKAEICVRSMNIPALLKANEKVNRCIRGAAIAMGGHAEIEDSPGQMPLKSCDAMADIFVRNAEAFYRKDEILPCLQATASFDMGDLSMFMPVLHSISSGVSGGLHSKDYRVFNEEDAYIIPVKIMTGTLIDLLYGQAETARKIIKRFVPICTKKEYLQLLDDIEKIIRY